MFDRKFLLVTVIATFLILGGGIFLMGGNSKPREISAQFMKGGKVEVLNNKADWGKINYEGGLKSEIFEIKNIGDSNLLLRNIKTSCHCTKAEVKINGTTSPAFGMSGASTWIGEIKPQEKADLKVIFDPKFHGIKGLGPIERYVKVETSDPSKSYLEFSVKGVVEK